MARTRSGPDAAAAAISGSRGSGDPQSLADAEEDRDALRDDDSEVDQVSRSIGVMKVQNDRQFYASEAHWWAILSDVSTSP